MAYTTLTLFLQQGNSAANTTFQFSSTNSSFAAAQQAIQQITLNGGVFDNLNNWYPLSAIIKISAS